MMSDVRVTHMDWPIKANVTEVALPYVRHPYETQPSTGSTNAHEGLALVSSVSLCLTARECQH